MRYIDLFAGVGGFRYGIERACHQLANEKPEPSESDEEVPLWKRQVISKMSRLRRRFGNTDGDEHSILSRPKAGVWQFDCVYSNEWDKYANSVYRRHYGQCDQRDIRTVDVSEIPDHDLIVGGFPCQAFSHAGKRGGFSDTRGTLFFEIARIAKQKRTPYLLLENVKGLLSHDKGKTIDTMLRTLYELGYDIQWQVLNSKDHGVPQNRERIFIIANLRDRPRPEVFFETGDGRQDSPVHKGTEEITPTLTSHYAKNQSDATYLIDEEYDDTVYHEIRGNKFRSKMKGMSPTLVARMALGGNNVPCVVKRQPLKFLGRNQKNIEGDYAYAVDTMNTNGVKILQHVRDHTGKEIHYNERDVAGTLKQPSGNQQNFVKAEARIRRLTPKECERLQGFPDDWTKYGADGEEISDTQRYKMMGNAVTTNVITAIVSQWCKWYS